MHKKWIAGQLENVLDGDLTLHQWEIIKKRADEISEPTEERRDAIARARRELFEFVAKLAKRQKKGSVPRGAGRFVMDGRKPSEHLAPDRVDLDASEHGIGQHLLGRNMPETKPKHLSQLQVGSPPVELARPKRADEVCQFTREPSSGEPLEELIRRKVVVRSRTIGS